MTKPLRERLIIAALYGLQKHDPVITIGVGENEIRITWNPDVVRETLEKVRNREDE